MVENQTSEDCHVTSGLPQGSILGPLLFLVYISDLPDQLSSSLALVYLLADDSKLLALNCDLIGCFPLLEEWTFNNKMIFHPKKSKVMSCYGNPPQYKFSNEAIEVTRTHRDLGLILNDNLTWTDHN